MLPNQRNLAETKGRRKNDWDDRGFSEAGVKVLTKEWPIEKWEKRMRGIPRQGEECLAAVLVEMRLWAKDKDKPTTSQNTKMAHIAADDLLCIALRSLGQNELVKTYQEVNKWYS